LSPPELDVPGLLRQHKLHPNKALGQNFLVDEAALLEVVKAAMITPQDDVLEIGPGLGSLTRQLAVHARRVVAVEIDGSLMPALRQVVGQFANVTIIQGDILSINLEQIFTQPDYLVVANIPYNITSALLRHLLESASAPRRLVLTIQQEVAQRICASPGDMSLLALSVQVYGHPEICASIPAGAFYPPPNVDSAVLRVERYPTPAIPVNYLEIFFQLIKAGFSQKRKTLRNAMAAGLRLPPPVVEELLSSSQINPMRRAETLSLTEWNQLTLKFIAQLGGKQGFGLSPQEEKSSRQQA
jgi:16S rRNA (adenine1518-N6/adenine1519-N6)-dimethyltransferase